MEGRREASELLERTAYRPPAAWYRRLNWLGVLLTSQGLAPRDAVTLQVRGRTSGKLRRVPIRGLVVGAMTQVLRDDLCPLGRREFLEVDLLGVASDLMPGDTNGFEDLMILRTRVSAPGSSPAAG